MGAPVPLGEVRFLAIGRVLRASAGSQRVDELVGSEPLQTIGLRRELAIAHLRDNRRPLSGPKVHAHPRDWQPAAGGVRAITDSEDPRLC